MDTPTKLDHYAEAVRVGVQVYEIEMTRARELAVEVDEHIAKADAETIEIGKTLILAKTEARATKVAWKTFCADAKISVSSANNKIAAANGGKSPAELRADNVKSSAKNRAATKALETNDKNDHHVMVTPEPDPIPIPFGGRIRDLEPTAPAADAISIANEPEQPAGGEVVSLLDAQAATDIRERYPNGLQGYTAEELVSGVDAKGESVFEPGDPVEHAKAIAYNNIVSSAFNLGLAHGFSAEALATALKSEGMTKVQLASFIATLEKINEHV